MIYLTEYTHTHIHTTRLSHLSNLIRNICTETLIFFTCFLVLTHQKEREDKTPTPEVSNCGLALDNNPEPVGSLDTTAVSTLRRRNVPARSNPYVVSAMDDNITDSAPTFFDLSTGVNFEVKAARDSRKCIKYPKVSASYPEILRNSEKISPRDIKRSGRTDAAFSKPPCSQSPVFLKCKIKEKIPSEDKMGGGAAADDQSDDQIPAVSQTTDLDIQFSKLEFESFIVSDSPAKNVRDDTSDDGTNAQTLKQYCDFEEKKLIRVAPHIHRKDVICDTVDAWSYDNAMSNNTFESFKRKPLVFGGTYPIDVPLRFRNDHCRQTAGERGGATSFAKKNVSLTYDIDVPTECE